MSKSVRVTDDLVINKIYHIRGEKVMMDRDLAEMYGVETSQLKRQVKRNISRFPSDFMFEMTKNELEDWRCQFGISNQEKMGLRYPPFCFTEQGVAMLSSVLNSNTAVEVNIQIIRIFTRIRKAIVSEKDMLLSIEKLESKVLIHNQKVNKHEEEIQAIFNALKQLLETPQNPRKKVGYKPDVKD